MEIATIAAEKTKPLTEKDFERMAEMFPDLAPRLLQLRDEPSALRPRNCNKTEQVVQTPPEFMRAVKNVFGPIGFDLAALSSNSQADAGCDYFGPDHPWPDYRDSLCAPWEMIADTFIGPVRVSSRSMLAPLVPRFNWLNPPYARPLLWVRKAYEMGQIGFRTLVLLPASTGPRWWRDWVHGKCCIHLLSPRLKFVGHDASFPKDLALLVYDRDRTPEYLQTDWRAWLEAGADEIAA